MAATFRHLMGSELRMIRLLQGRTLKDIAAAAHTSHTHLSEIERGESDASSEILEAIFSALGVRIRVSFDVIVDRNGRDVRIISEREAVSMAKDCTVCDL